MSDALTKLELADDLAAQFGITKSSAYDFVCSFFDTLVENLAADETVKLDGFGSFQLREKTERSGARNPRTLEPCVIAARRVVKFKLSNKLKAELNGEAISSLP